MAFKNFFFMENWVGRLAGDLFWIPILTQKTQIWDSLNAMLMFNPLERQMQYHYQMCDLRQTKVKTSTIVTFCYEKKY